MTYVQINRHAYDALAEEYEALSEGKLRFTKGLITNFVKGLPSGSRVLDVGCGIGLASYVFTTLGYRVWGVDLSPIMLLHSRKRNPGLSLVAGDILELDFPARFDAVYAQALVHLFPRVDVKRVLRKLSEPLLDGGSLFLSATIGDREREGVAVKRHYDKRVKRFKHVWTRPALEEVVVSAGLRIDYSILTGDYSRPITWLILHCSVRRS